ncbi:MAG: outer membrane beta-barrel protein [Candidatus Aminicenantes bacterium]|nr:outer membrane beta-barrel protein [Candidatus Aminicenantes bacterium]
MGPKASIRVSVFFVASLLAAGTAPVSAQSRLEPFAALGVVHDALGRQESDFISFPMIGGGVLFRLGRVVSLGFEGEYARLGRFVSTTEILPDDPFDLAMKKYYSTATTWRFGLLARFRFSDRPLIPRLTVGAGYYRTVESAVAGVRNEYVSSGVGTNIGVGWRIASLGGRRSFSVEGRWHLGVGEAAGEVAFTSFLTASLWLTF